MRDFAFEGIDNVNMCRVYKLIHLKLTQCLVLLCMSQMIAWHGISHHLQPPTIVSWCYYFYTCEEVICKWDTVRKSSHQMQYEHEIKNCEFLYYSLNPCEDKFKFKFSRANMHAKCHRI